MSFSIRGVIMNKARISSSKSADVAAANDLAIGNGNKVLVTGNTTINGIHTLNWISGSEIDIMVSDTPTFKHNTAASSGYASLKLAGGVDFMASASDVITFWYDGTYWQEKCRKTHYEEGTFTATLTGVTATVTGTARYIRIGKIVTLFIPALTGTSNTTACTITGAASSIYPARDKRLNVPEVRNNGNTYPGAISIATDGVISLQFHATVPGGLTGAFANTNGKGLASDCEISYSLT